MWNRAPAAGAPRSTPFVQKMVFAEGGDIMSSTTEEFAALMRSELPMWARVIKRAGITTD
jgi:hypothetical protein